MSLSAADMARIGPSDLPSLLGISEWGGPVSLWARIVHGISGVSTEAMEEGTLAEPFIRSLYARRTGYTLRGPASWDNPLRPWFRCHPDDVAEAPGGSLSLELKRYQPHGFGPEGTDGVPLGVWIQVQAQIGVGLGCGAIEQERGDVAALLRGDLKIYTVPFNPEVFAHCIGVVERFWVDFVLTKRVPEGDNLRVLERDVEALKRLFPAPPAEAPLLEWGALTEGQKSTVRRWLEANAARKAWAKQEEALAGQVQLLLREAPGLLLPEELGRRVDFKPQAGVPRLDVKGLRAELASMSDGAVFLEMLERHTKKEDTRPLVAR